MGVTFTSNFNLAKPDLSEDMENWATQNETDCDDVDAVAVTSTGSYSPNLFASGTNPTLGNSTLAGHWCKPVPNFIWVWVEFEVGSTFSAGSGTYRFSLPELAHASYLKAATIGGGSVIGKAIWRNDDNVERSETGVCQFGPNVSGEDTVLICGEQDLGAFGTTFTFQTGDRIRFGVGYATA